MVQISATTNSVIFTFDGNQHYLSNGTIEVPKSSLALVIDDSNMATFKKAASNDIFVSVSLDELDMTKDELIAYYINNMVSAGGGGESGVTPEEVTQMIDTAIAPLEQDIDFLQDDVDDVSGAVETLSDEIDVKEQVISTAINELYDGIDEVYGNVGTLSGQVQTISSQTEGKADTTALTAHTSDATIHVTANDKTAWNGKLDADALAPYWTSAQTDTAITQATSGKANASAVEALSDEIDVKEEVISTAINKLYDGIGEVSGNVGTLSGQVTANTSNISTVSGDVQTLSTTVSGIQANLGGIKLVKLTRAEYEALTVKDTNTLYIIPDE